MKNSKKIAGSGLRVLEILKVLAKQPLTAQELLKIAEDLDDSIFRKEIVLKYINTLKALGFEIEKIKDKYYLLNGLERVNFSVKDLSMLLFIEKYASRLKHESLKGNLFGAINTIEKGFSSKTRNFIKENKINVYKSENDIVLRDDAVKKYEKYCRENLKLEITYKTDKTAKGVKYKVAPITLLYKKCAAVFVGYDYKSSEYKEFFVENITESMQLPQISTKSVVSAVSFKCSGRLAKAYHLKDNERVLEKGDDYIIVSNSHEDRDVLVKRLLRYYNQCEILYPKSCRDKMVNLIEEMEALYV